VVFTAMREADRCEEGIQSEAYPVPLISEAEPRLSTGIISGGLKVPKPGLRHSPLPRPNSQDQSPGVRIKSLCMTLMPHQD
jgi:hypothetical protein